MHFSPSTIVVVAAVLGAANALPHGSHWGAAAAENGDSGGTFPMALPSGFLEQLSSLLGATPTGGASFPDSGSSEGAFQNSGNELPGIPSTPTPPVDIPHGGGAFSTPTATVGDPFTVPTSAAEVVPSGGAEFPGFGSPSTTAIPTSVAGIIPSDGAIPTGGVGSSVSSVAGGISGPATTAPASLPTETIDWSTFSFVFASSTADTAFSFGNKN